jgi:AraC-like DNA-binding protein
MIYLERRPSLALAGFIRTLWYASVPDAPHKHERILPSGLIQIVISLASDSLTECIEEGSHRVSFPIPPAIIAGPRSRFEIIHTRDLKELVGIVFEPGGAGPWMRHPAHDFFEQSVELDSIWPMRELRDRLREQITPERKLATLNTILCERLRGRLIERRLIVKAALHALRTSDVSQTSRTLGISDRRLRQIFHEDVGLSPKQWSRIQRFQQAVEMLYRGSEMRWDQLALECGFYDQSHFANDFRAFSGLDPTTYIARRGTWRNHLWLD